MFGAFQRGYYLTAFREATKRVAANPKDAAAMTLLGESDILKVDSEGRIGLTEALKAHAGIRTDVTFVGVGRKFQIWEPSRFQARLVEARQQASAWRSEVGTRPSGQAANRPFVPEARE